MVRSGIKKGEHPEGAHQERVAALYATPSGPLEPWTPKTLIPYKLPQGQPESESVVDADAQADALSFAVSLAI